MGQEGIFVSFLVVALEYRAKGRVYADRNGPVDGEEVDSVRK